MPVSFNADEILAVAEQIERNGVRFYLLAAERLPEFRDTFRQLAGQEEKHLAVFQKMRSGLSASEKETTAYDPDHQNSMYLKAMADREVFKINADPQKMFSPSVALAGVLDMAIGKEKDSIVFYVGMKELVPEKLGSGKIDAIIKEEFGHISVLRTMIAEKTIEP